MEIQPITLEGRFVRLEPLSLAHHARLCEVGLDEDLWKWIPQPVRTPEEMREYIQSALDAQAAGTALPFATIERASGRAIGSTRFGNIDRANRRVEIGWTWLGREFQRTAANTEAKYLMMRHAFETWASIRVELKTDSLNERSLAPSHPAHRGERRRHAPQPHDHLGWPPARHRVLRCYRKRMAAGKGTP